MGLLFALEPNQRQSGPDTLVLHTSKKRVGLGMGLMLGGVFLGTMFYAALPLFEKFIEEGEGFDKAVAYFFYAAVFTYPALAMLCFSYEQITKIQRNPQGFELLTFKRILFFKWGKKTVQLKAFSDLEIANWKGAVNTASIRAEEQGKQDRYSTKGHWMLKAKDVILERRARRDDIEWLVTQIEAHFSP
ncbi:hypothetical protein GW915_10620 [bacterium]|nr:hypothetical protein [bacterium]